MNYVLKHLDTVLWGPRPWNWISLQNALKEDLNLDIILPSKETEGPYVIDNDTIILPVREAAGPSYNAKTQYLEGPYWQYTNYEAISSYVPVNKSVDQLKGELKAFATAQRWNKETSGIEYQLGDQLLHISTSRDQRTTFSIGVPGKWKLTSVETLENNIKTYKPVWVSLLGSDIQSINQAIANHVQAAFEWEENIHNQIDSLNTLEDLDTLVIE